MLLERYRRDPTSHEYKEYDRNVSDFRLIKYSNVSKYKKYKKYTQFNTPLDLTHEAKVNIERATSFLFEYRKYIPAQVSDENKDSEYTVILKTLAGEQQKHKTTKASSLWSIFQYFLQSFTSMIKDIIEQEFDTNNPDKTRACLISKDGKIQANSLPN
jgi:hypothetical protein